MGRTSKFAADYTEEIEELEEKIANLGDDDPKQKLILTIEFTKLKIKRDALLRRNKRTNGNKTGSKDVSGLEEMQKEIDVLRKTTKKNLEKELNELEKSERKKIRAQQTARNRELRKETRKNNTAKQRKIEQEDHDLLLYDEPLFEHENEEEEEDKEEEEEEDAHEFFSKLRQKRAYAIGPDGQMYHLDKEGKATATVSMNRNAHLFNERLQDKTKEDNAARTIARLFKTNHTLKRRAQNENKRKALFQRNWNRRQSRMPRMQDKTKEDNAARTIARTFKQHKHKSFHAEGPGLDGARKF
jgi:hypothetical protein